MLTPARLAPRGTFFRLVNPGTVTLGMLYLFVFLAVQQADATGEATSNRSEGYTISLAKSFCANALAFECPAGEHVDSPQYGVTCTEDAQDGETWWACTATCWGLCSED